MNTDFDAALALLEQAMELAESIDEKPWTSPSAPFRDSTLGQHFRHILDHYESLLSGTENGLVDYDARNRDKQIEASPEAAAERCRELRRALICSLDGKHPTHLLKVKTACSVSGEISAQHSSFGRESLFLVSHTVHHFAIIAAICHGLGIAIPPTFGIAPSTLKYRETAGKE